MDSSFEDLEVWKKSCRLSIRLYDLLPARRFSLSNLSKRQVNLAGGKDCRDYGIKDQMLRASVSIASNIAEGSERNSIPDFQRFLNIAKGSAVPIKSGRTQVYISREINIFSNKEAKKLIMELKSISSRQVETGIIKCFE